MRKMNAPRTARPDQIAILVRRLAETSKSLQSLLADEGDAVLFPGGESFLLLPAQTSTRLAADMQRTILDAIPAHLAVLDPEGKIIFVNESWQRFVGQCEGPWKSIEIGQNYVEYCEPSKSPIWQPRSQSGHGYSEGAKGRDQHLQLGP